MPGWTSLSTVFRRETGGGQAQSRHGRRPPVLRWAAFEVAKRAWRKNSPDHEYYLASQRTHRGQNRAALSIARKLIRRAHHTLGELGEEAISEPVLPGSSA
jgi:hypothetical protein